MVTGVNFSLPAMGRVQPMDHPEKLYQEGFADFHNNLYDEAICKFTLALGCNPDQNLCMRILTARAVVYAVKQQYDKTIEDYTNALGCNPDQNQKAKLLVDRAAAYFASGKSEEAQADYLLALQCHPEIAVLAWIYLERGNFHADEGHHDLAIEDYNRALNVADDPQVRAEIGYQKGCIYVALENNEEAIAAFTAAYDCDPTDLELRFLILTGHAEIYLWMDRPEDSLHDLHFALESNLEEHQLLYLQSLIFWGRGIIFAKNNDHKQAIENFTQALECDPQNPKMKAQILYERGLVYVWQEEFDLCETDMSDAIVCSPIEDRSELLRMRGVARVSLKKYQEAIQDLTTALNINSVDEELKAQLLFCRGVAHRKNKNPDQAHRDWEAALRCNFTNEDLREAIEVELNKQSAGKDSVVKGG